MVVYGATDLCQGQPLSDFNQAGWQNMAQAVDGNPATYAFAAWQDNVGLVVDLGSVKEVGRAVVVWGVSASRSAPIHLQGSEDGLAYADLWTGTLAAHGAFVAQTDTLTFPIVRCRFFRILLTGPTVQGESFLLCSLSAYEGLYAATLTVHIEPSAPYQAQNFSVTGQALDRYGQPLVGETITARITDEAGATLLLSSTGQTDATGTYSITFLNTLSSGTYLANVDADAPTVTDSPNQGQIGDDPVGIAASSHTFTEDVPEALGFVIGTELLAPPPEAMAAAAGIALEENLTGRIALAFLLTAGGNGTPPTYALGDDDTLPLPGKTALAFTEDLAVTN